MLGRRVGHVDSPGGYSFERFRDDLATRIPAVPEFRTKLADSDLNLGHPVWVEDKDFDLSRHVNRIALPAPGGREELAEICGHIVSVPLERSKPLWEMWVIEGVDGTAAEDGGRLAMMLKVHHSVVDGVSAAHLLDQLLDRQPDAVLPDPVDGPGDAASWAIAADGLWRFVTLPWQLTKSIPVATTMIAKTVEPGDQRHGDGGAVLRADDALQRATRRQRATSPSSRWTCRTSRR